MTTNTRTRIDAHMHYMGDTPRSRELLEQLDLKMMNICVAEDAHGRWRHQAEIYRRLAEEFPDRFAWCTSFDLPRFDDPSYVTGVIEGLDRDFLDGAVACKAWKNFGMDVRKPSGQHMLVDDKLLEPIFAFVADRGKTLLMHIADPLDCWLPLRDGSPHYDYYSAHPEWHMFGRDDYPTHAQLMDARDAVAASHPSMRIVGAHLGSLEHDVNEIAARLDRYPNFAVDMSARLYDLAIQDVDAVRGFFEKYQDRILFGIDSGTWELASAKSPDKMEHLIERMILDYGNHFAYLESTGSVTLRDQELPALGLSDDVLEKIYRTNARTWYPGI